MFMRGQSLYEKYVSPSPAKQPSARGAGSWLLAALAADAPRQELWLQLFSSFPVPRAVLMGHADS